MSENEKVVFSLRDVIDAIEGASDEIQWFANSQTGEIECWVDPIYGGYYDEYEEEDLFEGDEWLALPEHDSHEDWRIMRDFAFELGGSVGNELFDAIQGRGAFRAFRFAAERAGVLQSWYAYKDERTSERAIEWLEESSLSWKDDRHENRKRDWRELLPDALRMQLQLVVLDGSFSVFQCEQVDSNLLEREFCSITKTCDELSVVCKTEDVPNETIAREDGWRALKVVGPLDFGLVGILARISSALADAEVPLFALSTYDTDYILVKGKMLGTAIKALEDHGCHIETEQPGGEAVAG